MLSDGLLYRKTRFSLYFLAQSNARQEKCYQHDFFSFQGIGFIVIIIVTVSYIFQDTLSTIGKKIFLNSHISAGILTLSFADCNVSGMRLKGRIILYFNRSSWV